MTLPDFSTSGTPTFHTDFVNNVTFKGQTDATFDGGTGQTKNLKAVPSKGSAGVRIPSASTSRALWKLPIT